jgi:hypothetical protein
MCAPSAASALVIWQSTFDGEPVPLGTFVLVPTADGWAADTGVIELQNNVAGEPSTGADGDIFVELDSTANSSMVRTVSAAGTYTLSWLYSPRPNVVAGSNGISVFLDGVLLDPPGDIAQPGGPQTDWQLFSTTITAGAGSVIRFAATGTSNSLGGYVDNITLSTAVPEPATWAMMIMGFAGMGALARSRRRAVAQG